MLTKNSAKVAMSLLRLCRAVTTTGSCVTKALRKNTISVQKNSLDLSCWSVRCFSAAAPKLDLVMVKKLREMTGAPMNDCKNALLESAKQTETDQVEFAVDWLRKKGKAAAAKKVGRAASEGLVGVTVNADNSRGAVVELNSETDFVARNEMFHALVFDILACSLNYTNPTIPEIMTSKSTVSNGTVDDHFVAVVTALRENIVLRRVQVVNAKGRGKVAGYVHQVSGTLGNSKLGRIGCMINTEPIKDSVPSDVIVDFGSKVAMHVAAAYPKHLNPEAVPAHAVKRETDLLLQQAADSKGKPQAVIDKMIAGRMSKYYEEMCLLNQRYLISEDGSKQPAVEKVAEAKGLKISEFVRFECGQELAGESTEAAAL